MNPALYVTVGTLSVLSIGLLLLTWSLLVVAKRADEQMAQMIADRYMDRRQQERRIEERRADQYHHDKEDTTSANVRLLDLRTKNTTTKEEAR